MPPPPSNKGEREYRRCLHKHKVGVDLSLSAEMEGHTRQINKTIRVGTRRLLVNLYHLNITRDMLRN